MAKGTLPERAQVVIVGGGVVGAAVAYHLALRGWTDVVLLEQNTLTSGTTWHAAGLITQARGTDSTRRVVQRSLEVFRNLETDTGFSTGFVETGTLNLATSQDRWEELVHQASAVRSSGVVAQLLDPDETLQKHPLLNPDGILGSLWFPQDGRGTATDTTISLARGASARGVRVLEGIRAVAVRTAGSRASTRFSSL